jgi:hypothetical protein
MRKTRITLSGVGLGLLCAAAWYVVFELGVLFDLEDSTHIHWGRVTVAAVISFIGGWGMVRLMVLLSSTPWNEDGRGL